jgi:hypothetical protein
MMLQLEDQREVIQTTQIQAMESQTMVLQSGKRREVTQTMMLQLEKQRKMTQTTQIQTIVLLQEKQEAMQVMMQLIMLRKVLKQ